MKRNTWETVNASTVEAIPNSTSRVTHPDVLRIEVGAVPAGMSADYEPADGALVCPAPSALRLVDTDHPVDAELVREPADIAASRGGDFDALLALLDPDVTLRADRAAVLAGASKEVRGAAAVAGTCSGRARFAELALVNGAVGAVWAPGGRPRVVFGFTVTRGKIVEIDLLADPERLRKLDLTVLNS